MPEEFASLDDALEAIVEFRDEREWAQYHTPRHLASALSIEASELQEELLWKSATEVSRYLQTEDGNERAQEEIGDVLIYALLFCERAGIDPLAAIAEKLKKNAKKYPAERSFDF